MYQPTWLIAGSRGDDGGGDKARGGAQQGLGLQLDLVRQAQSCAEAHLRKRGGRGPRSGVGWPPARNCGWSCSTDKPAPPREAFK